MKITKIISLLLYFFSIAIFATACSDDSNNVDDGETYVASGHPDWSPIMYQDGDKIVGAGPEIVSSILNELGMDISVNYVGGWDEAQAKTKTGEVDMLVAAYKNDERETYMDYTIPYTVDPVSVFVKKGSTFSFDNWEDLIDKQGIVTKGDSYGQEFDTFLDEKLNVKVADTPSEAFQMLLNNQGDYFVYAFYSGQNDISSLNLNDQIEILPNYVTSENFYITISKQSDLISYLPQINQILEQYISEGKIDETIQKYKN